MVAAAVAAAVAATVAGAVIWDQVRTIRPRDCNNIGPNY